MKLRAPSRGVVLVLAGAVGACGPSDDVPQTDCIADVSAGGLIITEIMANPDGEDSGKEWFEIYNATGGTVDLAGLRVLASREDGTAEQFHIVAEGAPMIGAGEYLVLGGVLEEFKPSYVDYGYGNGLGSLRNSAGRLALRCDDVSVDEVIYETMSDGVARGYTGDQTPSATGNDDLTAWCDATAQFDTDAFGSPGAPNESCGGAVPGTCDDNGTLRDTVKPVPGDLVITELMPDPDSPVADNTGEWFEIYVVNDVDLNGLQLGTTPGEVRLTINELTCQRVTAGSYVVFARSTDPLTNGELPVVDYPFSFGLTNSGSGLFVGVEDAVLDAVTYAGSTAGASRSLDPRSRTTADNDNEDNWCDGQTAYGPTTNLGTPGSANPQCAIAPPDDMCDDGGTLRPIVEATAGQVLVNELMADPNVVDDAVGEWFELRITADFDLNGLQIGTVDPTMGDALTVRMTVGGTQCQRVTAGSFVLFARTAAPETNGGLPAVDYTFSFGLVNSNRGLSVGYDDTPLHFITYTSTTAGAATSLDPGDGVTLCNAVDPYGADGNLGTPRAANPACTPM